jgi:hypothetical protein
VLRGYELSLILLGKVRQRAISFTANKDAILRRQIYTVVSSETIACALEAVTTRPLVVAVEIFMVEQWTLLSY